MKEVKQETNPDIIYLLKDYFTEDGIYTKELAAQEMIRTMEFRPEDICVLVGYEDNKFRGFLIGHLVDDRDYVYIDEAFSTADGDFALDGMNAFIEWCKLKNKKFVRFETERDSVQMTCTKRYGFKEHGVIMQRQI